MTAPPIDEPCLRIKVTLWVNGTEYYYTQLFGHVDKIEEMLARVAQTDIEGFILEGIENEST